MSLFAPLEDATKAAPRTAQRPQPGRVIDFQAARAKSQDEEFIRRVKEEVSRYDFAKR